MKLNACFAIIPLRNAERMNPRAEGRSEHRLPVQRAGQETLPNESAQRRENRARPNLAQTIGKES